MNEHGRLNELGANERPAWLGFKSTQMSMYRRLLLLSAVAVLSASCTSQGMLDIELLRKDQADDAAARLEHVDAFMQQLKLEGGPIIENDTTVVFIYRGPAERVRLMGDMTQWADEIPFERIDGTDVFYYRGTFPTKARLEYVLLLDGKAPVVDSLNPHAVLSGFGPFSELVMPGYEYHPAFESVRDGTPGGYDRVIRYELPVGMMGYATEIHVYVPPGYESSDKHHPVVYIQDGRDYIEFAHTPTLLDAMVASGQIEPVITVFVSPPNRHRAEMPNRATEYGLNPDYARFMAEEVVPFVNERYHVIDNPAARLVTGDSFAGLVSVYIPFQYPEVFGLGYSQSGYLSLKGDSMISLFEEADPKPIRLFVDVGHYERMVGKGWLPDNEIDFLAGNRRFNEVLEAKGYDYVYREYPEGHTWGNWRAHLADALIHFFPAGRKEDQ